jgi:16S rRNA (guanine527-N7)-methyltransferase
VQNNVSRETFLAALQESLFSLSIILPPAVLSKSADLYALLLLWNRTHNLTRITDPVEAARRHFAESFVLLSVPEALPEGGRCADIGSGAGFPGLPLAMARPDLSWTLVEKVGKKASFLIFAAATLGLTNVTVRAVDARRLPDRFDRVTFRALSSDPSFIAELIPLLSPDGQFALFLGPEQAVPARFFGTESSISLHDRSFRIALLRPG